MLIRDVFSLLKYSIKGATLEILNSARKVVSSSCRVVVSLSKMASTPYRKAFPVLQLAKCDSVDTIQWMFHTKILQLGSDIQFRQRGKEYEKKVCVQRESCKCQNVF